EAARDELEAARLTDGPYWLQGTPFKGTVATGVYTGSYGVWRLGANIVQTPGRPREHYELALRWAEARSRAGVSARPADPLPGGTKWIDGRRIASGTVGGTATIALALF